jgi:hypothetical protein
MPIPKPTPKEDQKSFMQRCTSDDVMVKEYPNKQQRIAVCFVQWRDAKIR